MKNFMHSYFSTNTLNCLFESNALTIFDDFQLIALIVLYCTEQKSLPK